jgi:ectoine hydroxylase-related dioxygenase (phytanoyl-CoA dioxygenase family)
MSSPSASIADFGFARVESLVSATDCESIAGLVTPSAAASGGRRDLLNHAWCQSLSERVRAHPDIAAILPTGTRAILCTYFEKSTERNWLVPLHRDIHIPVARKVAHSSLRGWSSKDGMLFVQPPREILDALLAVRVHLDACGTDDGAIEVVPGSHRDERIDANSAGRARATLEAGKGDALLMRPLVLHASRKATGNSLRRVLHFVFGPERLPHGLEWRN